MLNVVLLPHFLSKVWEVLADHIAVAVVVGLILIAISYFRQKIIDLSAWFVHISLYGKWETTLAKEKGGAGVEVGSSKAEQPHETAQLHQFLTKVWGETKRKDNPKIVYKVRGRIIGEKLALVYQEVGGFDAGAILLTIKSKRLMSGYEVGCKLDEIGCQPEEAGSKPDKGLIYTYPYIWRRREDD